MAILVLDNTIQNYAWGSHTYIAELQGRHIPSDEPEAEVWMGAHPKAPSKVDGQSLQALINADPVAFLGDATAQRFQNNLPFLFKFLAAGQPLSIQAHPNLEQAREGFARENEIGISLAAPNRNYKDDNHKPEIVCALSEFWGLNGFRSVSEILELIDEAGLTELAEECRILSESPDRDGLKAFFLAIMELADDRVKRLLEQLQTSASERAGQRPEYEWVTTISAIYPGDIGVLCIVLLNLVKLQPGEAMFCAAGDLHAYLDGFGVELMANSDNVLRGGLTVKHVDTPELMRTLTFRTGQPEILVPDNGVYTTPVDEFVLKVIDLDACGRYESPDQHGFELLASAGGKAVLCDASGEVSIELKPGQACAVTASEGRYRLTGNALIYKASVKGA